MATSGTATFNPDLETIMQEAHDRACLKFQGGYSWKSAVRSLNLLIAELSNRGLNLWSMDQKTVALVAGTATITTPADTIDVLDAFIRTGDGNQYLQQDLQLSRESLAVYAQQPNKLVPGRPVQFMVQRLTGTVTVTLWPVPDTAIPYSLYYTRLRRTEDAGGFVNTIDVPFRYYDCVIAGLAYRVAGKSRESMDLLPRLKAEFDESLALAESEDRDRSSVMLVPWIGIPV